MFDIAAQFGDNLVRSRKLADLSQDELSFLASVHRTEISQLERGLRIARIDTLAKLYGSLEVVTRFVDPDAFEILTSAHPHLKPSEIFGS